MIGRDRGELLKTYERLTDPPLLALSLALLPILIVPLFVSLSDGLELTLYLLDGFIWAIFGLDLSIRTYLSQDRRRYLVTHWFDVLIVVVFPLRPLRVLRSLRVLRLMRVAPLIIRGFRETRHLLRQRGLQWIVLSALGALIFCGTLVFLFERNGDGSIDDYGTAIWFAFTTMTTVGYGDTYPVTPEGRAAAVALMIIGITFLGWMTANIAAFLVEFGGDADTVSMSDLMRKLESLEEQVKALTKSDQVA
jgi:voltage-gated potassium channel